MRPEYAEERARNDVLTAGTLARFVDGLTWPEIHALDTKRGDAAWVRSIADAEQRGLIEWWKTDRVWRLTDAGREYVRDVS